MWKALARRLAPTGRARFKAFDPDTREYLKVRRITDTLPSVMAAVYLYHHRRTTLIALDFDTKLGGRAQVDADVSRAREWLTSCGARIISDRSTNGGRHLLVPLAIGTTAGFDELQPLLRGLKARLPSLDITPMQNAAEGCISVPGTPCSGGGHRVLDGTIAAAVAALTERSDPALLPQLYALMGALPDPPAAAVSSSSSAVGAHVTGEGADMRLIERLRWTKPVPQLVATFAREGLAAEQWRLPTGEMRQRWASPSEARFSVVMNAVLRGASLNEIRLQIRPGGPLAGLGDAYRTKYGALADRQLTRDVTRVFEQLSTLAPETNQPVHGNNYSQRGNPQGPIGRWLSYALAWADHEFAGSSSRWTVRDVLQALAIKAALAGEIKAGTPVVGVGGRSLSLSAGLMPATTVFDTLKRIREMVGSPLILVRRGVGLNADFYALTSSNPDNLTPVPVERIAVADVHPAWSVLGRQHRVVHDLIVHTGMTRPADIYAAARISARSGQLTLGELASAGLIVRTSRTVAPGPVTVDDIADAHRLGAVKDDLIARYRRERADWHSWLARQDQLRSSPTPPDTGVALVPAAPESGHEEEYLSAVLATGPPDPDVEAAAIELLAEVLGARILVAAAPAEDG